MKVYVCTDHDFHWPVGVASVVIAPDIQTARRLLDNQLALDGLAIFDESPYTLQDVSLDMPQAIILCDGDY